MFFQDSQHSILSCSPSMLVLIRPTKMSSKEIFVLHLLIISLLTCLNKKNQIIYFSRSSLHTLQSTSQEFIQDFFEKGLFFQYLFFFNFKPFCTATPFNKSSISILFIVANLISFDILNGSCSIHAVFLMT